MFGKKTRAWYRTKKENELFSLYGSCQENMDSVLKMIIPYMWGNSILLAEQAILREVHYSRHRPTVDLPLLTPLSTVLCEA